MMMSQTGGDPAQEAALRKAVSAMRGMSDNQVQMVAKAAAAVSGGVTRLRAFKERLAAQPLLAAAVAVLLLALLLRWLGWA